MFFQVHPHHISVTAVLVDYNTKTGRHMKGVATAWLKLKQVYLSLDLIKIHVHSLHVSAIRNITKGILIFCIFDLLS